MPAHGFNRWEAGIGPIIKGLTVTTAHKVRFKEDAFT